MPTPHSLLPHLTGTTIAQLPHDGLSQSAPEGSVDVGGAESIGGPGVTSVEDGVIAVGCKKAAGLILATGKALRLTAIAPVECPLNKLHQGQVIGLAQFDALHLLIGQLGQDGMPFDKQSRLVLPIEQGSQRIGHTHLIPGGRFDVKNAIAPPKLQVPIVITGTIGNLIQVELGAPVKGTRFDWNKKVGMKAVAGHVHIELTRVILWKTPFSRCEGGDREQRRATDKGDGNHGDRLSDPFAPTIPTPHHFPSLLSLKLQCNPCPHFSRLTPILPPPSCIPLPSAFLYPSAL